MQRKRDEAPQCSSSQVTGTGSRRRRVRARSHRAGAVDSPAVHGCLSPAPKAMGQ